METYNIIQRWDGSELLDQFLIPADADTTAAIKTYMLAELEDDRKDILKYNPDITEDEIAFAMVYTPADIQGMDERELMDDGWTVESIELRDPANTGATA